MNRMTHYHTNATLILPDQTGIYIDGMIVEHVDLSQDDLSITFKFQQDSYCLKKVEVLIQQYGFGMMYPYLLKDRDKLKISIDGNRFFVYDVSVDEKEMVVTFKISKI